MNQETDCKKCKGKGYLKTYVHVEGGRCYRCGGSGKEADYQKKVAENKRRNSKEYKDAYKKHLANIRATSNSLY